jgi:hypothetical protein
MSSPVIKKKKTSVPKPELFCSLFPTGKLGGRRSSEGREYGREF